MNTLKNTYLSRLLGEKVTNVTSDISFLMPIDSNGNANEEVTSIYTQIYFTKHRLHIYNRSNIFSSTNCQMNDLINLTVVSVSEKKDTYAEIIFERDIKLNIDLRDEAYNGPEAMALFGLEDDFWVVWN